MGFPVVGTGQWNALCCSSSSVFDCKARLRTLPAFILLRLPLRFRLPPLLSDGFFFSVLLRDRLTLSDGPMDPESELERCMVEVLAGPACSTGPSMIELPR